MTLVCSLVFGNVARWKDHVTSFTTATQLGHARIKRFSRQSVTLFLTLPCFALHYLDDLSLKLLELHPKIPFLRGSLYKNLKYAIIMIKAKPKSRWYQLFQWFHSGCVFTSRPLMCNFSMYWKPRFSWSGINLLFPSRPVMENRAKVVGNWGESHHPLRLFKRTKRLGTSTRARPGAPKPIN